MVGDNFGEKCHFVGKIGTTNLRVDSAFAEPLVVARVEGHVVTGCDENHCDGAYAVDHAGVDPGGFELALGLEVGTGDRGRKSLLRRHGGWM